MRKLIISIAISLAAGFALASIWTGSSEPENVESASVDFDASADTADRLLALEQALSEERAARQLLEEQLFLLIDDVGQLEIASEESAEPPVPVAEVRNETRSRFQRGQVSEQDRASQLVGAGFSEDRASWIADREAQLRMQAMQDQFEARRNGEEASFFSSRQNAERLLRDELGDIEYEQYLEASNRPTAVSVNNVMEFSPAEQAGLQSGDRILRYDGQRVFSVWEMNELQISGTAGQNVVVDIERDGVPMQVSIPRGPLGIMAGRGRR